jgi:proteasome lid subunit RPN8/RPN11
LSQDDIVFDEVRYREPVRLRRPDRDRKYACLAYEVPGPEDLPVFVDHATADAIERHALRDTSVELGGILLGKECVDDQTGAPFVLVTTSLEARHYENTQASFTYTHDSWEEITRERDARHPDLDIVGWYHTHPDFGVFLSSHDLFIQRHFFSQPLQVAYVVDPVRHTRGFFRWRDGQMEQTGGFYLTADRADRATLARVANDLENLTDATANANPGAGLGGFAAGLSPRLEAELIAMLTRPSTHAHAPTTADRAQTAVLFSLLGAMLGVLGVSAVLWLNTLSGHVQEQARALDELRKTVAESAERQRVALDAAGRGGGLSSKEFVENYATAVRERDDARHKLDAQVSANALLADRTRALADDLARAKKTEADAAAKLSAEITSLKEVGDRQARELAEFDDLFRSAAGDKATALTASYRNTWYAAVGGWAVSLALALALAGLYLSGRPPQEPSPEPPPHHIA